MPRIQFLLRAIAVALLAMALFLARAQKPNLSASQEKRDVPMLRATSRSVVLDVVVTDGHGHPTPGLTQQDFALQEDGVPQTIASFEATSNGHNPAGFAPKTILLVDEMNTAFTDFAFVRYSLSRLLGRERQQLDAPTALYDLTNQGLLVLCDFTRDPEAIKTALEKRAAVLPWRFYQGTYGGLERVNQSLWVLGEIASANLGVPGRKNVVWISPGFPLFNAFEIDPVQQGRLFDDIRRLSDKLLRARLSVYSIDPRGVLGLAYAYSSDAQFAAYVQGLENSGQAAFGDVAIQTLAVQTGGRALFGRNDVDREIATSLAESESYYTLSYTPSNRRFNGKFRRIKVAVSRPGVTVRTRDGYYALPEGSAPRVQDLQRELSEALSSPLRYGGVLILSTATELSRKPDRVKIRVDVRSTDLTWSDGAGGEQTSAVYLGGLEIGQKELPGVARPFIASLPHGVVPGPNVAIAFALEMPVRYPLERIRVAVSDVGSGRMGSANISGLVAPKGPAPFTGLQRR